MNTVRELKKAAARELTKPRLPLRIAGGVALLGLVGLFWLNAGTGVTARGPNLALVNSLADSGLKALLAIKF
jgi:uncharacterized membrane protein